MDTRENNILMRHKNILFIALATVFILLIPLVAMQFTDEVNWGLSDFIIIGALLFGTGLVYELIVKKIGNTTYRAVAGIALAVVLFLIWAEFAVGIFGTPFAGS